MCREVESKRGERVNKKGQAHFFRLGSPKMLGSVTKKEKVGGVSRGRRRRAHLGMHERETQDRMRKPCWNG